MHKRFAAVVCFEVEFEHHASKRDLGLAARNYTGAAAAPSIYGLRLFAFLSMPARAWLPFYGGPCGDTRKGVPVLCPVRQPCTVHHLCLAA